MNMMKHLFGLSLMISLLSACGQKGSLYLPDESTPVIEPTPISDDMNDY